MTGCDAIGETSVAYGVVPSLRTSAVRKSMSEGDRNSASLSDGQHCHFVIHEFSTLGEIGMCSLSPIVGRE